MREYLTPGVYFEFRDSALPTIRRGRMDIAGFVGLAERGPLHQAVQIDSWRQFQAIFGDFLPYGFLAYTVKGFFENGGRTCFVVRIAGNTAAKASLTLKNSTRTDIFQVLAANEGSWGNQIAIALTQINPTTLSFSLLVMRERLNREVFPNLSINPENERYFVRLINQGSERIAPSQWIKVEDLLPLEMIRTAMFLPDVIQSGLKNQIGFLTGGKDGIASLILDDFLGTSDLLTTERRGLSVFDRIDAIGIIAIPDIHIRPVLQPEPPPVVKPPEDPCLPHCEYSSLLNPPSFPPPPILEQPPEFSVEDIFTVQQAMVEHCEKQQDRVAILDAILRSDGKTSLTISEILDWRSRFDSERGFAALYYPWIRVVDPQPSAELRSKPLAKERLRNIPPCGHIAGLYARSDFTIGVHKAPANSELFWAEDTTVSINDEEQAILNPESVNCVRAFPGRGIRVYGARTISSNPDWRYINVRRLLSMIEEAVDESTQWAVFEPHDFMLRRSLILSISSFLETIWRQGGLVGNTAAEAYFIKCDETNNPPSIVNQGKLIADIGVAPTHPAEFIIFRVGRTVEELEIVER
ncbi:phage tail sheath family protein [Floridanema evergladense]|uniref:Phage tail sheath family protein n=1 Tax=Floridaenema evergladense BLCC-F167 TaxID=3153639 RepID=A0ABV4WJT4_9CYAN